MRTVAAILAAGGSTRIGVDKTLEKLGRRPVWRWSYDAYKIHPLITDVFVVVSPRNESEIAASGVRTVPGGATRQQSAHFALQACGAADILLFHDAARPFVDANTISKTIAAIETSGAAGAAVAVKDTIRETFPVQRCLSRDNLRAMQTPQGGRVELLRRAYQNADPDATDDLALFEGLGIEPVLVEGSASNFKITTSEDLSMARTIAGSQHPRVGSGYDVHSFGTDKSRILMLGGVPFPGARALEGHSDADVLLHAVVDALLGAAALGDIGQHFPNTNKEWKNKPSIHFLAAARLLLREAGWSIVNVDATVVAEEPQIMAKAGEIRRTMGDCLGIGPDCVSVKATTNERLGFIGRSEGIAAFATCLIAPD